MQMKFLILKGEHFSQQKAAEMLYEVRRGGEAVWGSERHSNFQAGFFC